MAKGFRFIEHTADMGLVAWGETLSEAFASAACGLFSIMAELKGVREVESRFLELGEADKESLLFEWLNRLIYIFEVEMLLLKRFDITYFNERQLKAVCYGEKYDPFRHQLKKGVKSATYHMLSVDDAKNKIQVIFDI